MSWCLKIGIVDDEPLARMRMRHVLAGCEARTEVVGEWSHGAALLASAQQWHRNDDAPSLQPDVLFLDIEMPGDNGLALARALQSMQVTCPVVFVTAHPEHALAAFEVDAVDYLTKPIRQERLESALQRVATRLGLGTSRAEGWVVQHEGALLRVDLADVLYFKAEHKHVVMRTKDATYNMDASLNDLAQQCGDAMLRIHRNALVSVQAMHKLAKQIEPETEHETWLLTVSPVGDTLAVSRRQVALVKEKMASR